MSVGATVSKSGPAEPAGANNVESIRALLTQNTDALLAHRYFHLCRTDGMSRGEILGVLKHLCCFSTLFERLLTRRIAEYSSLKDPHILRLARQHLQEEAGHAEEFRDCLLENGVSAEELEGIAPKMYTKALFGYLVTTIQHENEYVANVAIMQVMETISPHFFSATLQALRSKSMTGRVVETHAEEEHARFGFDLIARFDPQTMAAARQVIEDVYRLMWFVFDEWLDVGRPTSGFISWATEAEPATAT